MGCKGTADTGKKRLGRGSCHVHGSFRNPEQEGKVYQGTVMHKSVIPAKRFTIISDDDHGNSLVY